MVWLSQVSFSLVLASVSSSAFVERILGRVSFSDVRIAFTDAHNERPNYRWDCEVELRGEAINIVGFFYCKDTVIGRFERRLYYENGYSRAKHVMMELQGMHQEKGLAREHYRKALRFYQRSGIRFIHLDADVDGPSVWPQFGFDLESRKDKELLGRIMREFKVASVPSDARDIFAPDVAAIESPCERDEPTGLILFKELRRRADRPLPMILDLKNELQWTFLVEDGILDSEDSK